MQSEDPRFPLSTYELVNPSAGTMWPAGCRLTRQPDGGVGPAGTDRVGEFFSVYPSTISTRGEPVGCTRTAATAGDALYTAANGLVANVQATGAVFVGTAQATINAAGLLSVA